MAPCDRSAPISGRFRSLELLIATREDSAFVFRNIPQAAITKRKWLAINKRAPTIDKRAKPYGSVTHLNTLRQIRRKHLVIFW